MHHNDSSIVISETITGKIYIVNLTNKSYNFIGRIPGANGVAYEASTKTLYACGIGGFGNNTVKGKLYEKNINNTDTLFTELKESPSGVFDGLELMDDAHLLITDWINFAEHKGRIVIYDLKNHTDKEYVLASPMPDIHYNKARQNFYMLQDNTLLIGKLSDLK